MPNSFENTLTKELNDLTARENEVVSAFFKNVFNSLKAEEISGSERKTIDDVINYVANRFSSMKYILGLAIDFILLAEGLAIYDQNLNKFNPSLTKAELFNQYKLVTKVGKKTTNTLSLKFKGNKKVGIRKFEELVVALFHEINRTDYPSAYVYNTGQWTKYQDLLTNCFKLSQHGRVYAVLKLIAYGLNKMERNIFFERRGDRRNLFFDIILNYTRSAAGENGGLTFQSLVYGFICADRPHLNIIADKVRTGSARQKRIGDIDCYRGIELEMSVEVKDMDIGKQNFGRELGAFVNNIDDGNLFGTVASRSIDSDIFKLLHSRNIASITNNDLRRTVATWDWSKQNNAVDGMLHYLSHIEQNEQATKRLQCFIKERGYDHLSLLYYDTKES
jgi:hypothetical protein